MTAEKLVVHRIMPLAEPEEALQSLPKFNVPTVALTWDMFSWENV
jgi:hypothetical protein